jgi:hypothetical protein
MKHFLYAFAAGVLLLSGCPQRTPPPSRPALTRTEAERCVDRLIEMGWLKYVAESKRGQVRSQLVVAATKGYLDTDWDQYGISADQRSYPADGKELANGGVGKCILQMKTVLAREGVSLDEVEDSWHEDKYHVLINREPYLIYDGRTADAVRPSLERLLEIINGLLEEAGSNERLFAVFRGTEGRIVLLTDEMQDYLESFGDVLSRGWMPFSAEEVESAEEP